MEGWDMYQERTDEIVLYQGADPGLYRFRHYKGFDTILFLSKNN